MVENYKEKKKSINQWRKKVVALKVQGMYNCYLTLNVEQISLFMCTMQHPVFEAAVCCGEAAMWIQVLKNHVYADKLNILGVTV